MGIDLCLQKENLRLLVLQFAKKHLSLVIHGLLPQAVKVPQHAVEAVGKRLEFTCVVWAGHILGTPLVDPSDAGYEIQ